MASRQLPEKISKALRSRSIGTPALVTTHGALYHEDCLEFLKKVKTGSIDIVFADPPFNLGKAYGQHYDDAISEDKYLRWCRAWLKGCIRVLKPGGALFVYNLPRWNMVIGSDLVNLGLNFRHWIAIAHTAGFPIRGRLHPSHYSLLYFTKGDPRVFSRIRSPIRKCRRCGAELKDYGGYRDKMHQQGVTLKDVWDDIPPVRHAKYKSKHRSENALSTKILERVLNMSSASGDVVLDPFGGSGTTYAVAEKLHRYWIGSELGPIAAIRERLESRSLGFHKNEDSVEDADPL